MKKKHLKMASFILQSIYCMGCIFDMILCLTYRNSFGTFFATQCAHWALKLTGILFFVPAMPISFILNILAQPPKQSERTERRRWLIWTIISPVIYLVFFISAVCVFVATTGGI